MGAEIAHDAQPAIGAVTASVSGVTNPIGAAEGYRTRGAGRGASVQAPTPAAAPHHIPARAGDPAGRFPDMDRVSMRVTGVSSPNFPAALSNEPSAAGSFWGASPLVIAAAVLLDLWPIWAVVAAGVLLAGQP